MFACNYVERDGADVGDQVDMHKCTDAYTHSNQGMGPEKGGWEHASGAKQQHTSEHGYFSFCLF